MVRAHVGGHESWTLEGGEWRIGVHCSGDGDVDTCGLS